VYARDKAANAQISEASLACRTRLESEDGLFVKLPFARPSVGREESPILAAVLEIVVYMIEPSIIEIMKEEKM
jgi:hypothetical protein